MANQQMTARVPKAFRDVAGDGGLGTKAKDAALAALAEGLAPITPPDPQVERASVYLDVASAARIQAVANESGVPPRDVVRDYAYAYWMRHYYTARPPDEQAESEGGGDGVDPAAYADALGMGNRPDQTNLFTDLAGALDGGRIAMAEGSTGVGKSRIIAGAALRAFDQGATPVVVAAPSIAVLTQLLREWRGAVTATASERPPSAVVRLGRAQFIDPEALQAWLDDPPSALSEADRQAAWQWLMDGGPPVPAEDGFHPAQVDERLAYLREDLERLAPGLPCDDLLLAQPAEKPIDRDNPAEAVYQALAEAEGDVIFASHALVGVHLRLARMNGAGLLPDPIATLLVDEAHQLEEIVANTMGAMVTAQGIRALLRDPEHQQVLRKARAKTAADRVIQAATAYRDAFAGAEWAGRDTAVHLTEDDSYAARRTRQFLDAMDTGLSELAGKVNGPLGRHLSDLQATLQIRKTMPLIRVGLSPQRHYPRLHIGPSSVHKWLYEGLWDRVTAGAAVSATLFNVDGQGRYTVEYMRYVLGIPRERLQALTPRHASWVWTVPRVRQPAPTDAEAWRPPQTPDQGEAWAEVPNFYRRVASVIEQAAGDTRAGVLVLITAYRDIALLSDLLAESLGDRLVVQHRGEPFARFQQAYSERVDAGERPVWLATGVAWTGLDLGERVSDLIIPRLPGGQPTVTAAHRAKVMRDAWLKEQMIRMRQGMGRLVRQEGEQDQRLWLLDGRLVAPTQKDRGQTRALRKLIEKYPHRERLDPRDRAATSQTG